MRKTFLMLLAVVLAGLCCFVGDVCAKELKDVKLDVKKFPSRRLCYGLYSIARDERQLDVEEVLPELLPDRSLSSYEFETKAMGSELVIEYRIDFMGMVWEGRSICKRNIFLFPKSEELTLTSLKEVKTITGVFKNGMRKTVEGGIEKRDLYPEDTVASLMLLQIIPQVPREKAVRYEFDCIQYSGLPNPIKPEGDVRFAIVYMGKEDFLIGGKKTYFHRYDVVDVQQPGRYYVDDDGLVQFVMSKIGVMKLFDGSEFESYKKIRKQKRIDFQNLIEELDSGVQGALFDIKRLKKLLDDDSSLVNHKADDGESLVHSAARQGDFEVVKLLVDRGADLTAVDKDNRNCLYKTNDSEIADYLIKKSEKLVKGQDSYGWNPLRYAVSRSREKLAGALIENGADVNSTSKDGMAPLHYLKDDSIGLGKMLLAAGADVNIKDNRGRTPLDIAVKRKRSKVIELLKKHGAVGGNGIK